LDCNLCSLLETISQVFNWLLAISAAVAVLFLVVSGFLYLGSSGKKALFLSAKQYTKSVILGFAIVLLSWLVIQSSLAAIGSNTGEWWSFKCDLGQNGLGEMTTESLISSVNNSGEISGVISTETKAVDLNRLYDNLPEEELLVFSLSEGGAVEPWAILGKKEGSLEILYLDARKIKYLETSRGNFSPKIALAKENEVLQEMAQTIKRLVFEFIESRKDQIVTVIKRPPNLKVNPKDISSKIPAEIKENLSLVKSCLGSGGVWYRFPDQCSFEKLYNPKSECGTGGTKRHDSCKCPINKKITQTGSCE